MNFAFGLIGGPYSYTGKAHLPTDVVFQHKENEMTMMMVHSQKQTAEGGHCICTTKKTQNGLIEQAVFLAFYAHIFLAKY